MQARENDGDCDGVRVIVSTDSGGGDNKDIWSELAWADSPTVFQRHWTVLGYSRQKWDAGHPNYMLHPKASVEGNSWSQLSEEERAAADAIGYSKEMWDNGDSPTGVGVLHSPLASSQKRIFNPLTKGGAKGAEAKASSGDTEMVLLSEV